MELKNTFEVAAPPKSSWDFLLDPERVTPCIPGAELVKVDDDGTWHVKAKVKLGPVTMNYKGKVNIVEMDEGSLKVVMKGSGTETRGKGTVKADIVSQLRENEGGGTNAEITSVVKIAGKAAQFGRGMIADVASRFTTDFAEAMEQALAEASADDAAEAADEATEAADRAAEQAKTALAAQREEETRADPDQVATEAEALAREPLERMKEFLARTEAAASKAEKAATSAETRAGKAEKAADDAEALTG